MRNRKKFTKGCKIPHSPPFSGSRAGRAEVILSPLTPSIYLASSIYIPNVQPIYLQYTATICPARKRYISNIHTNI